jgi:1,4-alpha-glucan branching enzyme
MASNRRSEGASVNHDEGQILQLILKGSAADREALRSAEHNRPHGFLGPHRARVGEVDGTVVRVFHPEASGADFIPAVGKAKAMEALGDGFFALWLPDRASKAKKKALEYRQCFHFSDGSSWERGDPYRFPPTIGEVDLYLLAEGTHRQLWECLGARPMEHEGVEGFAFSVWAPNARRVSLVGEFCHWDGRLFPMHHLDPSGIFDLFLPGFQPGELYKFEIITAAGDRILKADPLARFAEEPSGTASRTFRSSYEWLDGDWMAMVEKRDVTREPVAIYEVHLASWMRGADRDPTEGEKGPPAQDRLLSYRELAPRLVAHVKRLGFNYLELLPVAEHPFHGSWGYQITGYFAPTARHGTPDDFRFFVDTCHQHGIGVLIDWVPAHFVKDAHGLGQFDGSALYEHADPRRGEHPDWGTYIFNYGRWEVRNFLLSNALYWLEEFHIDGLRVDAVASMIYLDYSREEGQWVPNVHGGHENLEALEFLRATNEAVRERYPGRFTVAEESTAWPGVTKAVVEGGLGFTFKWNMGWMHDTLGYFGVDPLFRSGCHDQLTFAMCYEYSEHYLNPISHDEVVHGKGSLYTRMPGDSWRKLANLRSLFAYQLTRPGKKLLFMGSELATPREWNHEGSLDWFLLADPARKGTFEFLGELGHLYLDHRCLWEADPDPESFRWIACDDKDRSLFCYERRSGGEEKPRSHVQRLVVVLNLTPVPREKVRFGALTPGPYRLLLSSDEKRFGGSGYAVPEVVESEEVECDGLPQSLVLDLPPLAVLILEPEIVESTVEPTAVE